MVNLCTNKSLSLKEAVQLLLMTYSDLKSLLSITLLWLALTSMTAVEAAASASQDVGYKVGQTAPEFQLKSLAGKTWTLAALRNKGYVMLVFWAVDCVYCYAHVKDFNALHAKYKDKGLTIAAINIGAEYDDDVAEYVKDNNIKYLVLSNRLDNLDVAEAYHSVVTPTMVIVSPEGKVVYYGYSLPDISKFIK